MHFAFDDTLEIRGRGMEADVGGEVIWNKKNQRLLIFSEAFHQWRKY